VDEDYLTKRNLTEQSVHACNGHVLANSNKWTLCVSPGFIQGSNLLQTFSSVCLYHDCYTHPGNSGSPVVLQSDPTKFVAIHFGEGSQNRSMNVALPVTNPCFIECYAKYVLPNLPKDDPHKLKGLDEYLKDVQSKITTNGDLAAEFIRICLDCEKKDKMTDLVITKDIKVEKNTTSVEENATKTFSTPVSERPSENSGLIMVMYDDVDIETLILTAMYFS